MGRERRVRDIMVPIRDYPTVRAEASLYEAAAMINVYLKRDEGVWHGFRSVMVVDDGGGVIGVLTLRTVLRAVLYAAGKGDPAVEGSSWGGFMLRDVRRQGGPRVREVMRPATLIAVSPDDSVWDAALKMARNRINSLPVVERRRPVGIVRSIDVFWWISELLEE
ncbi:MAG: CBS domain-containing protein [Thermoanaerobacterales bacterium]|nr:CBS domain-containing protein [Bacillota bacterium]MDI6906078.1 CBS domain-containing protein [Thermoanaerobacterales bacterium]